MSYVAGFTDPAIETHQELYDILVNGMAVHLLMGIAICFF